MKLSISVEAHEWLFLRNFLYIDKQYKPYFYETNWLKRKKEFEPSKHEKMPYILIDNNGILMNHQNQKGDWLRWDWADTKSIHVYYLMQPWKSAIYDWLHEVDNYRERRKTIRYFRTMKWRYRFFPYKYQDSYPHYYSIVLEGRKGNGQFAIPLSWAASEKLSLLMETIERTSGKEIEYFNTGENWHEHVSSLLPEKE